MYVPPSTSEIAAQIIAAIEARIGQTTPVLPVAFVRVLAFALAGPLALAYRFITWAYRQIFPATADAESLAYLGDKYEMPRGAAVAARLQLTVSGDDGTNVPAGTLWASAVSRLVYEQVTLAVISGGVASVEVECLTPGAAGNLADSSALSLPSPLPGVTGAVVSSTVVTGEDEEALDTYRARLLQRMREQPQGGAAGDYIRWALEVAGIVKAFATRNSGGDVLVYPLVATTGSARVPAAGKLAEVEAYLQDPARRPLAANVYAITTTERTVDVTVTGLSPADDATKANILSAIEDYLYAAYPRQYLDDPSPTHIISLAALWGIIIAQGAVATGVTMAVSGIGSGVTTYEIPMGEIVKLGALSWA